MRIALRALSACVAAAASLAIASCASLPLPDTPEQSLLILASDVTTGSADNVRISSVALMVMRGDDQRRFTVNLSSSRGYSAIAVDPGPYVIDGIRLTKVRAATDKQPEQSWDEFSKVPPLKLYVEKTVVLLCESLFFFKGAGNGRVEFRFVPLSFYPDKRKKEIVEDLRKDRHWLGWEGYQLVNLPAE